MARVTIGKITASNIGRGASGVRVNGPNIEVQVGEMSLDRIEGDALNIVEHGPAAAAPAKKSLASKAGDAATNVVTGVLSSVIASKLP